MLEVIGLENRIKWRDIVLQFENHDVYYLPQYTQAFAIHGDGQPNLFYFESENFRAVNVVMKRDLSKCKFLPRAMKSNTLFDITTPYGYGGFLVEGDADRKGIERLNEQYTAYCRGENIISEFVRFHPLLENHAGLESVYEIRELGRAISMDLTSPQVIESNIRPRTRKRISKAEMDGVEIHMGQLWAADLRFGNPGRYSDNKISNSAIKYNNTRKRTVVVCPPVLDSDRITATRKGKYRYRTRTSYR